MHKCLEINERILRFMERESRSNENVTQFLKTSLFLIDLLTAWHSIRAVCARPSYPSRETSYGFASGVKEIPRNTISALVAWAIVVTCAEAPVSTIRTTRFEFTHPL